MAQFRKHNTWDSSQIEILRSQIESYFSNLQFGAKKNSTQRGSYIGRRVKLRLGQPNFDIFLDALTEAAIFYETDVKRLSRTKRGQVPDINKKIFLYDILTATKKLLNEPVGIYQIDPSTEHTRSEGFVIELARHISSLIGFPFPKYLHHLLSTARNTQRI